MRTKILGLALLASMLFCNLASYASASPAYSPAHIDFPGSQVVYHVSEGSPFFKSELSYSVNSRTSSTQDQRQVWCKSLQQSNCNVNSTSNIGAVSILPACSVTDIDNCIESVSISDKNGKFVETKFSHELGGYTIPADSSKNYIGGRSASIWSTTEALHQGGVGTYIVSAQLNSGWNNELKKFKQEGIFVNVTPFVGKPGPYEATSWLTDAQLEESAKSPQWKGYEKQFIPPVRQGLQDQSCFFHDDGLCGVMYDFAEGSRVKVTLRASKDLGGWFSGRIEDPKIEIQDYSTSMNLLTINGAAVKIPRMVHLVPWAEFTGEEERNYVKYFWGGAIPGDLMAGPPADSGDFAFDFINSFKAKVRDTASGFTSTWNFRTVSSGQGSKCLNDTSKVLGIVTTNSMSYQRTAPIFNRETLEYKVAGLHFAPDGQTALKGTYDLILRSETARCLYGFTDAPISASISITSGDGSTQEIASEVVSERDGWLSLSARNFTFSAPILNVKLTQEKPKVVAPSPSGSPTQVAVKVPVKVAVKSLKCVKGKIVKTIKGTNPKCPAGYKTK